MADTKPALPADYGDASPEQVAKAIGRFRPEHEKPWAKVHIVRGDDGAPYSGEITYHDEKPALS